MPWPAGHSPRCQRGAYDALCESCNVRREKRERAIADARKAVVEAARESVRDDFATVRLIAAVRGLEEAEKS